MIGDSFRNANVRQGDPLGMSKMEAYLIADNQQVDVGNRSILFLSSNNTTAGNRTFTLVGSKLVGHQLVVIFTSGASTTAQLANSGTCRLQNGAWEPSQYSSITLVSDGTYWYEQNRGTSVLQASASVAVVGDAQAVATAALSTIFLDSDSATATSRSITLTADSVVGHVLTLVFVADGGEKIELLAASTTKLTEAWYPNQYDTMTLVSDGTNWIEVARTAGGASTAVVVETTLAADNTAVTTVGRRVIFIDSDSTATARTFTLAASNRVGQKLTLVWTHATNRGELAVDSTTKLSGRWAPAQYDTLDLVSDGTRWIEVGRTGGNSAGDVASVALIGDAQAVATEGLRLIILTSDDATAANRTFVPTASPVVGHELTLLWNSANEGQLADTATVILVGGAWEPTNLYQNIKLISDGTRWIEVSRADQT